MGVFIIRRLLPQPFETFSAQRRWRAQKQERIDLLIQSRRFMVLRLGFEFYQTSILKTQCYI